MTPDHDSLINQPLNSPSHAFPHIQTYMHNTTLLLNHQDDDNVRWLSDRSWSEASVACHHDLSTVKHGSVQPLSTLAGYY